MQIGVSSSAECAAKATTQCRSRALDIHHYPPKRYNKKNTRPPPIACLVHQPKFTFIADIDMSMPGFADLPGSSARVCLHGGFPVPCCAALAPKAPPVVPNPPNAPAAGAGAGAPNAPVAGAGAAAPNNPPPAAGVVDVPNPPKPVEPVAGAAPKTPPAAGAGAGAPNGLDAGLPKGLVAEVLEPKLPPRVLATVAGAPNGPAVGAGAPNAPVVVAPKAPVAAGAAVVAPNGLVEAVRPKAEVPAVAPPNTPAPGAGAGAPKTLGLAPNAVLPKLEVVVVPNVCNMKGGDKKKMLKRKKRGRRVLVSRRTHEEVGRATEDISFFVV